MTVIKNGTMRIILEDGFAIQKGAGIGQYSIDLFDELKRFDKNGNVCLAEKRLLNLIRLPTIRRIFYIVWLNLGLQLLLRKKKIDIIHFTNFLIPNVRLSKAKYVVTIHDLVFLKFPETLPYLYVPYIRWATFNSLKRADLILTDSNSIKEDIINTFSIDANKIYTLYPGISDVFFSKPKISYNKALFIRDKFGIKKDYLLFVGTIEKRKNVITLIKAFEKLVNYKDLQLVLVGRTGYGSSKIAKYLDDKNLQDKIVITGYVSEEEKIAIYDLATAFIFPSLYEGFGLPLVEAMSRGVPIVASRVPSTEEVTERAALYYENPFDSEELAIQIMKLLEDDSLRGYLIMKGLGRARRFSLKEFGRQCLNMYQKLLSTGE